MGREPDGHFGVDDWVDVHRTGLGDLGQGITGPIPPRRILREDVQQDVAVDQRPRGHLRILW